MLATESFDRLWVWDDPALGGALNWYRQVATNRRPAKFRIAATVPAQFTPSSDETALWAELDRLTPEFLACWQDIRVGRTTLAPVQRPNLLDLCDALVRRWLAHCTFCRWNCRVDRSHDGSSRIGACKLGEASRVSSHFHHPGEELVYRGTAGSGTIFFTSCNMRCAFCQNGDISTDKDNGIDTDGRTLAAIAWTLRMEGCHNVNWVGGEVTIHLHRIVEAIALLGNGFKPGPADLARARRTRADRFCWHDTRAEDASYAGHLNAPMLWNSNFFMTDEAMKILRLLMDVWLPDFKFGPGRCAMTLAKTPWYWETVTGNLLMLHGAGEDMTIRHLVMPGHVECCTVPMLDWLARHMPDVPINIMDQYRPDNFCEPGSDKYRPEYAALTRGITRAEFSAACAHAASRGIKFETITFEKARRFLG
ncbi:MAG: pyruvate formate lyase activating enzyme [Alphaproteobacteria bacterium]|nr:pyruvate formate lyase activating enzyme [Alphaproteobacteria bacterium]